MANTPFPKVRRSTYRAGQRVWWRNYHRAETNGWVESFGPGPFEIVYVVDRSWQNLPDGLILKTKMGEREINAIWVSLMD
jgi:hypothetical protein